jgi:hypothetical protein
MKPNSIYSDMTLAEKEVAEFLRKIDIWWQYEQPVYVLDDKERPRVWTPDFYLPELGIYIEVCGSKRFGYEYREKIYKKNKISVIFIHKFKSKKDWHYFLKKRIQEIHKNRWQIIKNRLLDNNL